MNKEYKTYELIKAISENKIEEGTIFTDGTFDYEVKKDKEGFWYIDFNHEGEGGISLFIDNVLTLKKKVNNE